jgi:uncharacterized repeat protein (TIGR03803 family)
VRRGSLIAAALLAGLLAAPAAAQAPPVSYEVLHHFDRPGGSAGATPSAGLVEGPDGAIYGTTLGGGPGGQGTLFRYERSAGFVELVAFDGAGGARPRGDLLRAADGSLYGTTTRGGTYDAGTLFRYEIPTADFTVLHSFGAASDPGPSGALAEGPDALYGTTWDEPHFSSGTIYRFDFSSAAVTTLHTFFPEGGAASGVIKGADGALYGTKVGFGGPSGRGELFRCDVTTVPATVSTLRTFSPSDVPRGGVVEAADGSLWGPHQPGAGGWGRLYRYRPATGAYATVHQFSGTDGDIPTGALIVGPGGVLYGTTERGGAADNGAIFQFDPKGASPRPVGDGVLNVLWSFHGKDGARPVARLLQASDGALYGTTSEGGALGGGVLFRLKVGRR